MAKEKQKVEPYWGEKLLESYSLATYAAAAERRMIMAEYIKCRNCESPDCKGCNLKNLETMLKNGKFDCLMNGNRCINTSAEVEPVRHGHFVHDGPRFSGGVDWWHCSNCGRMASGVETRFDYCPWCGEKMDLEQFGKAELFQ